MSNIQIIDETTAIKRINDTMGEMDLDDLAQLLSYVCAIGRVVVAADGNDQMTVQDVIDNDVAASDVYENGVLVGVLVENGTVAEVSDRYERGDICDEQDVGEFNTAIDANSLVSIHDNVQGQTIAWVYDKDSWIVDYLNKAL